MNYIPTFNLRFVERKVTTQKAGQYGGVVTDTTFVRFLQQGWAPEGGGQIEWRDVPLAARECDCAAYCSLCMPASTASAG